MGGHLPPKTQRERDEEKRKEKLEHVSEQEKAGSLTIRQMTDEEKAKYARPEGAPPPGRGRKR